MSTSHQGREWDQLKEEQRNCLIWPDFLEWGPEHLVEIKRSEENSDLGIISVALIDVESTICYNIIKRVLEGKPASGKVNLFDWITAVDGKSTLGINGSKELVKLIRNGKDTVHLSIKTAIEPLVNIKQWSKERTKVELKVISKKPEFELAHFYSKGKNENIEDHILIFKVQSKTRAESTSPNSMQLNRGDELLSVNGKAVTGKKLRDIYELILNSSKVEMDIKKIIRGETPQELKGSKESEKSLAVAAPAGIKQQQRRRRGSQEKRSQASRSSSSDEKFLNSDPSIAQLQEDDHASTSEDVSSDSSGMKEPLSPTKSDGASRTRRFSFGRKKSQVLDFYLENDAYASSDTGSKKNLDLCCNCDKLEGNGNFKRLAENKRLWSLKRIEHISFQKICDGLDRNIYKADLGKVATLMEVSAEDLRRIKQQFLEKGGFGAAEIILLRWTKGKKSNNIGIFQEILETVERKDIIDIIDEWLEKENICNGCGSLIN